MNRWLMLLADDPPRIEMLPTVVLAAMLLASCVVWCVLPAVYFRRANAEMPAPPEQTSISFPAFALAIFLIASSLLAKFQPPATPPQAVQVQQLQSRCVEGLLIWGLLFGSLLLVPGISFQKYGFRSEGWPRQLGIGSLAFLASFLPVYALLWATNPLRSTETQHAFLTLLQTDSGPHTVFWIGLSVAVKAPFLEEMIYRVILQTSLEHWLPASVAISATAVVFCLVHGWPDMIPLLPLALILSWVYHRYRSYLAVVATHALFNSWMFGWALLVPKP